MSNRNKWLIGAGLLLFILFVLFFGLRNPLLRYVVNQRLVVMEERLGADIQYKSVTFKGMTGVQINNLCVLTEKGDTLLSVKQLLFQAKTLPLFGLKLRVKQVSIQEPRLRLWRQDGESNYLCLFKSTLDTLPKAGAKVKATDYNILVRRLFDPLFRYIPEKLEIYHATLTADIDANSFGISMNELLMNKGQFLTLVDIQDNGRAMQWKVEAGIEKSEQNLFFHLSSTDTSRVELPYVENRWNLLLAFDSLKMDCHYSPRGSDEAILSGNALAWQQVFNHPGISPYDVVLSKGFANYKLNFGDGWAEVDSATNITYNNQEFNLFARYDQLPEKRMRLAIHEPSIDAQVFFSSLPDGLFTNLVGIKVAGELSFNLDFDYSPARPDSLVFNAALKSHNFNLLSYGETNFAIINAPFLYTAWEKGVAVRSFMVGPENPDFRPLDQISDYLKHAIMTSEDGAFFYHNGFIASAIRESIITNLKQKRFARGGSTISMQLVKNVFLNRNKTITRKVEEMLITWLIETKHLVSKERMLEVYLNVIETGPGIYGVNEASRFYFKKEVKNLTLAESIFLASIVPRPKAYKYSFTEEGQLKPHLEGYYSLVSSKMLGKGWITETEYEALEPRVKLVGPALAQVNSSLEHEPEPVEEKGGFFNFKWLKRR